MNRHKYPWQVRDEKEEDDPHEDDGQVVLVAAPVGIVLLPRLALRVLAFVGRLRRCWRKGRRFVGANAAAATASRSGRLAIGAVGIAIRRARASSAPSDLNHSGKVYA